MIDILFLHFLFQKSKNVQATNDVRQKESLKRKPDLVPNTQVFQASFDAVASFLVGIG